MEDYCKYLLENWKILSLGSSAILTPPSQHRKKDSGSFHGSSF